MQHWTALKGPERLTFRYSNGVERFLKNLDTRASEAKSDCERFSAISMKVSVGSVGDRAIWLNLR